MWVDGERGRTEILENPGLRRGPWRLTGGEEKEREVGHRPGY